MAVDVHWEWVGEQPLTDAAVAAAVEASLEHGGRGGIELVVIFVDDPTLADLHARFLDDPSVTDVMSFDLGEGPGPAGEVYVSVDRARERAQVRGVDLSRELCLYVVHGVLHLCGFDDHTESERSAMRAAEGLVMTSLGHHGDDAPHEFGA